MIIVYIYHLPYLIPLPPYSSSTLISEYQRVSECQDARVSEDVRIADNPSLLLIRKRINPLNNPVVY